MQLTDDKVAEAFRETRSYSKAGKKLGVSRGVIERRVLKMKARGVKLPEPSFTPYFASISAEERQKILQKAKEGKRRKSNETNL